MRPSPIFKLHFAAPIVIISILHSHSEQIYEELDSAVLCRTFRKAVKGVAYTQSSNC
jgi:hypothetical protein